MNHPEQARLQVVIAFENTGVAFKSDLAIDQHIRAVDDRQHGFGVVLDDHHRDLAAQLDQRFHHLLDDGRRQTFERLVQQDQLARHDQRAGDRHHLTLAAGKIFGLGFLPGPQPRKQVEDLFQADAAGRGRPVADSP